MSSLVSPMKEGSVSLSIEVSRMFYFITVANLKYWTSMYPS